MNAFNMNLLPKQQSGCPYLLLAPMEGVGDLAFRKAISKVGGMDETCSEFLRVPKNAHVPSLAKAYHPHETPPLPQAAQIMGSDPHLMASMAAALQKRGAPRIDINCGCPSKTVTGRGAGSSLLKNPKWLFDVAQAVKKASTIPVTAKLRSGFENTALFEENLLAAQEAGMSYIALHPRTKVEGYKPPANWELIAKAKELLNIPVVGNGDINSVEDALSMLTQTKCDALMIGRGALKNPWLFLEIKAHFSGKNIEKLDDAYDQYIQNFVDALPESMPTKTKINKCKQLLSYLFQGCDRLKEKRLEMLRLKKDSLEEYLKALHLLISGL